MLEAVFRRGVGAYNTNPSSVRPSVNSADQWAYARVNVFLQAVRTGKYKSGKFDTDLLPEGHPLKSKDKNNINLQSLLGLHKKSYSMRLSLAPLISAPL